MNIFNVLGVLFIGLKLTGYIDWPWWLVVAPIFVPAILLLLFTVTALAFGKDVTIRRTK